METRELIFLLARGLIFLVAMMDIVMLVVSSNLMSDVFAILSLSCAIGYLFRTAKDNRK